MGVRKLWATTAVVGLLTAVGLTAPAAADPPSHVPRGPCIEDQQQIQLSSLPSYSDVVRILESIEGSSGGEVEVASAGVSGDGPEPSANSSPSS